MKKLFYTTVLLIMISCGKNTRTNHEYKGENFYCEYQTQDGRIEGHYISYNNDGEVKAEGYFENGYHRGNWKLWDSTGLVIERFYKTPFNCQIIIPDSTKEIPDSVYVLKRNNKGFYPDFDLTEQMIVYAKRIWRYIPSDKNPLIKTGDLFPVWQKSVVEGHFLYKKEAELEKSNSNKFSYYSTDTKLLGYKIVEDFVYDKIRKVSEKRILGIAPVVKGNDGKTTTLPWIYLPDIRTDLAAINLDDSSLPDNIKTLDDLFFFRYFSSRIYKEENPYLETHEEDVLADGMEKESERVEMELINQEHDLWVE